MRTLVAVLSLAFSLAVPACAGRQQKPQEQGITREQADAILNELKQIRQLLEKGAAPAANASVDSSGRVRMSLGDGPWLGRKEAPLTIVEFTDYQCGFCQRFHTSTFPELRKKYIDSGKVRFVSRDLPLDFHSNAFRAAVSARCAGDQGQFWALRDRMVAEPSHLSPADILGYARELKLKLPEFEACVKSNKYAEAVRADSATASSLRIDGTPAFIIGKSTPDGVLGSVVMGALPLDAFEGKLEEAAQ